MPTKSDYNFSWFEGAKEQKCYCGAENCRGFIGKRIAPPKSNTQKKDHNNSPQKKDNKGKVIVAKVKRVVEGRVTKVSTKKVKAQMKNGKVVKATMISRTKIKGEKGGTKVQVKKTVKKVNATTKMANMKSPKKADNTTKVSLLGKRKRPDSDAKTSKSKKIATPIKKTANSTKKNPTPTKTKAKEGGTPNKAAIMGRKIAKPVSKSPVKKSAGVNRPIYDTVSHRPHKRNLR
jgi:hypothetical protein